MFPSSLERSAESLDAFVRDLDVEVLDLGDAQRLVGALARMGRQVDAAVALLSARVADGARDDDEAIRWLASETAENPREAQQRLEAGRAVRSHDETRRAFQGGDLSQGTAKAIGAAAEVDPGAEHDLVSGARVGAADDVRDRANRTRRRAQRSREDEERRHARRHRQRSLTSWEDDDGGITGRFCATTVQWAPISAALEVYREAAFRRARRTEVRADRGSAYAMDGLELMAHLAAGGVPADLGYVDADLPAALRRGLAGRSGGEVGTDRDGVAGRSGRPGRSYGGFGKALVRIDAASLRRGWAEGDEVCEIAGVGTVPVAAVRELLPEAFVAVVITEGHDVVNVAHVGRRPDAFQASALQWTGATCCTRGCGHTARIEADHDDPWAATHYTWLPGLNPACDQCHKRKTLHGWAWLDDRDDAGRRTFVAPTDPRHPARTGDVPGRPPLIHDKQTGVTRPGGGEPSDAKGRPPPMARHPAGDRPRPPSAAHDGASVHADADDGRDRGQVAFPLLV